MMMEITPEQARAEFARRKAAQSTTLADDTAGDQGCPGPFVDQAMRLNARAAIQERIGHLRREAAQLEMLLDALPAKLPPAADEALWQLVMRSPR